MANERAVRHERNFNDAEIKLKSICRVIDTTLEVAYKTHVVAGHDEPEPTIAVRMLRHLFELADVSHPF